jgi:hypothetical protein
MFPDLDSIYFTPAHAPFLADDSRVGVATNLLVWGPQVLWVVGALALLWLAMFRRKGGSRTFLLCLSYGMILVVLAFLWTSLGVQLGPCHPENPYDVHCRNRVDFAYLSLPTRYGLLALLACHAWFWLLRRQPPAPTAAPRP